MNKIICILAFFAAINSASGQFVDPSNNPAMTDTLNTDVVLRNRSLNGGTFQYMTPTMFKSFMASLIFNGTIKGSNARNICRWR